ncbi:MAG: ABC transporter substrate-binding protein [Lachnospiraceae bacterium]|nr:ABC transporter substrate-binding protein [Lachnospiraceae bacterium]
MKKFKKLVAVLCLATMVLGLTACGSSQNQNETIPTPVVTEDSNVTVTPEASEEPTEAPADEQTDASVTYPVTITDSNETEITLEEEPQKVISVAPNITEMIYALGAEDKLVGRTNFCDYPAEVESVESIGTLRSPDVEKIIDLEPDVVIASTHFAEDVEQQLTDLGIKVVVLYEEHEVTGVYTMIETMGTMFNKTAEAEEIVTGMKDSIAQTESLVEGLEAPSVYYVVGFGEGGDYTAGGDTFVSGLITLAGGNNIASDVSGWSYSLESLVEADPDIIVVRAGQKEAFSSADTYKDLTAVKNGRVYEINNNLLDRQGVRNAEGVRALAEIFYPEVFANK